MLKASPSPSAVRGRFIPQAVPNRPFRPLGRCELAPLMRDHCDAVVSESERVSRRLGTGSSAGTRALGYV